MQNRTSMISLVKGENRGFPRASENGRFLVSLLLVLVAFCLSAWFLLHAEPDIHDKSCQGGKQRFPPCVRKRSLPGLSSARACGLLPLGVVPASCRTRHP